MALGKNEWGSHAHRREISCISSFFAPWKKKRSCHYTLACSKEELHIFLELSWFIACNLYWIVLVVVEIGSIFFSWKMKMHIDFLHATVCESWLAKTKWIITMVAAWAQYHEHLHNLFLFTAGVETICSITTNCFLKVMNICEDVKNTSMQVCFRNPFTHICQS